MDDLDLYGDLDNCYIDKDNEKKSDEFRNLNEKYEDALLKIQTLEKDLRAVNKKNKILEKNFHGLLATVRAELKRKDGLIHDLRQEKDNLVFRRNRPGLANNHNAALSEKTISYNENNNNSPVTNDVICTNSNIDKNSNINLENATTSCNPFRTVSIVENIDNNSPVLKAEKRNRSSDRTEQSRYPEKLTGFSDQTNHDRYPKNFNGSSNQTVHDRYSKKLSESEVNAKSTTAYETKSKPISISTYRGRIEDSKKNYDGKLCDVENNNLKDTIKNVEKSRRDSYKSHENDRRSRSDRNCDTQTKPNKKESSRSTERLKSRDRTEERKKSYPETDRKYKSSQKKETRTETKDSRTYETERSSRRDSGRNELRDDTKKTRSSERSEGKDLRNILRKKHDKDLPKTSSSLRNSSKSRDTLKNKHEVIPNSSKNTSSSGREDNRQRERRRSITVDSKLKEKEKLNKEKEKSEKPDIQDEKSKNKPNKESTIPVDSKLKENEKLNKEKEQSEQPDILNKEKEQSEQPDIQDEKSKNKTNKENETPEKSDSEIDDIERLLREKRALLEELSLETENNTVAEDDVELPRLLQSPDEIILELMDMELETELTDACFVEDNIVPNKNSGVTVGKEYVLTNTDLKLFEELSSDIDFNTITEGEKSELDIYEDVDGSKTGDNDNRNDNISSVENNESKCNENEDQIFRKQEHVNIAEISNSIEQDIANIFCDVSDEDTDFDWDNGNEHLKCVSTHKPNRVELDSPKAVNRETTVQATPSTIVSQSPSSQIFETPGKPVKPFHPPQDGKALKKIYDIFGPSPNGSPVVGLNSVIRNFLNEESPVVAKEIESPVKNAKSNNEKSTSESFEPTKYLTDNFVKKTQSLSLPTHLNKCVQLEKRVADEIKDDEDIASEVDEKTKSPIKRKHLLNNSKEVEISNDEAQILSLEDILENSQNLISNPAKSDNSSDESLGDSEFFGLLTELETNESSVDNIDQKKNKSQRNSPISSSRKENVTLTAERRSSRLSSAKKSVQSNADKSESTQPPTHHVRNLLLTDLESDTVSSGGDDTNLRRTRRKSNLYDLINDNLQPVVKLQKTPIKTVREIKEDGKEESSTSSKTPEKTPLKRQKKTPVKFDSTNESSLIKELDCKHSLSPKGAEEQNILRRSRRKSVYSPSTESFRENVDEEPTTNVTSSIEKKSLNDSVQEEKGKEGNVLRRSRRKSVFYENVLEGIDEKSSSPSIADSDQSINEESTYGQKPPSRRSSPRSIVQNNSLNENNEPTISTTCTTTTNVTSSIKNKSLNDSVQESDTGEKEEMEIVLRRSRRKSVFYENVPERIDDKASSSSRAGSDQSNNEESTHGQKTPSRRTPYKSIIQNNSLNKNNEPTISSESPLRRSRRKSVFNQSTEFIPEKLSKVRETSPGSCSNNEEQPTPSKTPRKTPSKNKNVEDSNDSIKSPKDGPPKPVAKVPPKDKTSLSAEKRKPTQHGANCKSTERLSRIVKSKPNKYITTSSDDKDGTQSSDSVDDSPTSKASTPEKEKSAETPKKSPIQIIDNIVLYGSSQKKTPISKCKPKAANSTCSKKAKRKSMSFLEQQMELLKKALAAKIDESEEDAETSSDSAEETPNEGSSKCNKRRPEEDTINLISPPLAKRLKPTSITENDHTTTHKPPSESQPKTPAKGCRKMTNIDIFSDEEERRALRAKVPLRSPVSPQLLSKSQSKVTSPAISPTCTQLPIPIQSKIVSPANSIFDCSTSTAAPLPDLNLNDEQIMDINNEMMNIFKSPDDINNTYQSSLPPNCSLLNDLEISDFSETSSAVNNDSAEKINIATTASNYLIEKVSESVVNVFIKRRKGRKRKNT